MTPLTLLVLESSLMSPWACLASQGPTHSLGWMGLSEQGADSQSFYM